jgi:hypothetical protein
VLQQFCQKAVHNEGYIVLVDNRPAAVGIRGALQHMAFAVEEEREHRPVMFLAGPGREIETG